MKTMFKWAISVGVVWAIGSMAWMTYCDSPQGQQWIGYAITALIGGTFAGLMTCWLYEQHLKFEAENDEK